MKKKFKIITLGCKVNQCESASLGNGLINAGCIEADPDERAHMVLINTCIVTHRASAQSRQAIRSAIRKNPSALIVVTGCYAQTYPEELTKIKGVHIIAGNTVKDKLVDIILEGKPRTIPYVIHRDFKEQSCIYPLGGAGDLHRTRAFLKIQDGCDAFCSYCIVPFSRGPIKSMIPEEIILALKSLSEHGYKEVVLTGIHLGRYGHDLMPGKDLIYLLNLIDREKLPLRIRLSSIEPMEINNPLIDENGDTFTRGASGLLAQNFQHETDHLDGILFTDKAVNLHEEKPEKKVAENFNGLHEANR